MEGIGEIGAFIQDFGQEGLDPHTSRTLYRAIVQVTLMFGSETWVVTPRIGHTLGRFHYRVAHHLAVMHLNRGKTWWWYYPTLEV